MKRILLMAICVASALVGAFGATPADTALLVVHYGTARRPAPGLDDLNNALKTTFPRYTFFEAYTSPMVVKKLEKTGVEKLMPAEALDSINKDGYGTILIVSSTVIDGVEMASVREAAGKCKVKSKTVVADPLLYSVGDCRKVIDILVAGHPASESSHVAFIGHGTQHSANATYSQLAHILADRDLGNYHVATIEGYPDYDNLVRELRKGNARKVKLVPLMFVAGNHVVHDINREWKQRLEADGFEVESTMESLGQIAEIRQIYIDHLKAAMNKQ